MALTSPQLDNLVSELQDAFGPPFLPKGFVSVTRFEDTISVRIGPRDFQFDTCGCAVGRGTELSSDWVIKKRD